MKKSLELVIILFLALLASTLPCRGIDLSATEILNIEGKVEVKKGQEAAFQKLNRNLKLSGALKRLDGGDKVRTHSNSSAEMALKETCILAVKEQSLFEVPQTLGQNAVTQLKAQQGAILFKVISGSNFEVRTADVIAGVKGTLFELDIIDGFHTIIETPTIELGTIVPGGTMVNVYRGEVELTHAITGEKKTLKEGQGITVFNDPARGLNEIFKTGYGIIRTFKVDNLLGKNFGNSSLELLNFAPDLVSLKSSQGFGQFKARLDEPSQRAEAMLDGYSRDVIEKVHLHEIETGLDILKGLKGENYKANFSSFSQQKSPLSVDDRSFREAYLGNRTFAACKADFAAKRARFEATDEGLLLTEGNCSMRVIRFKDTESELEFAASYQDDQGARTTSVSVLKGQLFARIPGELDYYKVPAEAAAYLVAPGAQKGEWTKANPNDLKQATAKYSFKASEKFAREKKEVDKKNNRSRTNAVKKIINLKKFGF